MPASVKSTITPLPAISEDEWPTSTEVLIMGGGPVGLTCAMLLAQQGVDVLLVERRDFVFRFPRAHLLNTRTMEAFHDIDVADDIYAATPTHDRWRKAVWYTTAAGPGELDGVKIGEVPAWGGGPDAVRYRQSSPRAFANMPQIRLDPLLYRHALEAAPGRIRKRQEVISIDQDADAAVVTILDRDSGETEIKRYVAVDDVGNVVNPLIVDGQIHGGIVQGMAQALFEGAHYDDNGELITGTMSEYAVPKASMVPWFELDRTVTPSPVNPMGVKGAGEAGTIASTPAVANAVIDAISHLGISHVDMPMTPERVWRAIASASA